MDTIKLSLCTRRWQDLRWRARPRAWTPSSSAPAPAGGESGAGEQDRGHETRSARLLHPRADRLALESKTAGAGTIKLFFYTRGRSNWRQIGKTRPQTPSNSASTPVGGWIGVGEPRRGRRHHQAQLLHPRAAKMALESKIAGAGTHQTLLLHPRADEPAVKGKIAGAAPALLIVHTRGRTNRR